MEVWKNFRQSRTWGVWGSKREESQAEMQDLGLGTNIIIPNEESIGSVEKKDVGWKLVEGSVLE